MIDAYVDAALLGMISSGAGMAFANVTGKIYDYFYKKEPVPMIVFNDEYTNSIFIPFDEDSDWIHVNYISSQT